MNVISLHSNETLTRNELISITALVEYLAFTSGHHTENTCCHLAAHFNVTDVKSIRRRDYERAVRYLVDLGEMKIN